MRAHTHTYLHTFTDRQKEETARGKREREGERDRSTIARFLEGVRSSTLTSPEGQTCSTREGGPNIISRIVDHPHFDVPSAENRGAAGREAGLFARVFFFRVFCEGCVKYGSWWWVVVMKSRDLEEHALLIRNTSMHQNLRRESGGGGRGVKNQREGG